MPWPDLTYDEYSALGGGATEERFSAALPWAVRAVRARCLPNEPDECSEEAAKAAYVAAIECDLAWGGTHGAGLGGSLSVGGFSTSAPSGETEGYRPELARAIDDALAGSGLACRVVL